MRFRYNGPDRGASWIQRWRSTRCRRSTSSCSRTATTIISTNTPLGRSRGYTPQATWVVPLALGAYLRGWGVREIVELDWWQQAEVRGLRVTATPARHFSARRYGDRNKTLWCGFALEANGTRILFAGDTAYHPEFRQVGARCGPFDLVMVPIGAYEPRWFMHVVHVNPDEAVRIYQDLTAPHPRARPPLMLGIHWGTFRLTSEPMDEPPRRTAALWRERQLPEDRLWLAKFGETRRITPG